VNGVGFDNESKKKHNIVDPIYEKADEIKRIFEQIQFKRGIAIAEYVKAIR